MDRELNQERRWLDTAVKGIRFGPDRRAARAELAAHMEDKAADLRRIFPDMTAQEAEERAFVQRKAAGYDLGDGIWLFPMDTPEESFPRDWYTGASYTLRLYGGDGALLLEREGVLPEPV